MFCPLPFTRMEIKADGGVYCCCEGWLPRPMGNILTSNLMEIWRGEDAGQIRQSILDGSFRYCKACPYLPNPGGPVVAETHDVYPVGRVATLKLDYDQSCNLTCPSCRVTHSKNFVDVPRVQKIHDAVLRSGILDITDRVYVTGAGDPFASPLYWNFLENFPEVPRNEGLKIFLHTNGILCDEAHWKAMGKTADRVNEIGISVDAATEATYKINRGASWNKLWNNIDFVNKLQADGKDLMLGMFYTVQANNFRELVPFTRMAFNHGVTWISVTALRNWGTYTPEDYQGRAVHLPHHPEHAQFREVVADARLTCDPRIVLDSFNPEFIDQDVICNADALLPAAKLKRPSGSGS